MPNVIHATVVTAGDKYSLAVACPPDVPCTPDTIMAWGANGSGQLGDGTTMNRSVPVLVKDSTGTTMTGVTMVAAGLSFTLALKSDGTVWAWGSNSNGQLGNGSADNLAHAVPSKIEILSNVIAIAAGGAHAFAIQSDGSLWAWGDNMYGELGQGTNSQERSPVRVTTFTGDIVTAAAAGYDHSLVLTSTGAVYAFGRNDRWQLGGADSVTHLVPNLPAVVAIAAGASHSLAVTADDTVWAWGENGTGELGDNTTESRSNAAGLAAPVFSVSPTAAIILAGGGTGVIAVESCPNCVWQPTTTAEWISLSSGATGPGTVQFIVSATAMAVARSATIIVGGKRITVVQDGLNDIACAGDFSPNDTIPDDCFLQKLLNNPPADALIALSPGTVGYIIDGQTDNDGYHGLLLKINQTRLTSSNSPNRATIIAGRHLRDQILKTLGNVDDFVIENIRFLGMVDCTPENPDACAPLSAPTQAEGPWRIYRDECYDSGSGNHNPGNISLAGTGYVFSHNESRQAMCGSALGLFGSKYTVQYNDVTHNGRDGFAVPIRTCPSQIYNADGTCKYPDTPWSDGITAVECDNGVITNNFLLDNTDIALAIGGGPYCTVKSNTIQQSGKHSFLGLNPGHMNTGNHANSVFSDNTITSTAILPVTKADGTVMYAPTLGIGLLVGSHPWSSLKVFDVHDAGISENNTISGANVNVLIEGALDRDNPNNPNMTVSGVVRANKSTNPMSTGTLPCLVPHNNAAHSAHAKVSIPDGGFDELTFDDEHCENTDPADPAVQKVIHHRGLPQ